MLQATLLAPHASATALWLGWPLGESVWAKVGLEASRCTGSGAVVGAVDSQLATCELVVVELVYRRLGFLIGGELDKSEATRTTGCAIVGQVDVTYCTGCREQLLKFFFGTLESKVADKYFAGNGATPFVVL